MATKVFVFGASGHAKVVIDILERVQGVEITLVIDDAARVKGQTLCGHTVAGGRPELLAQRERVSAGIVTIGDNTARRDVAAWLTGQGFKLMSAIHPSAILARDVIVGAGTVIMAGCVINSDARIGANVIINTGATIDHDCVIADGAHIAPGCHLCGGVHIGPGTFLGAGSTVIPAVHIGATSIIGAGSTVLENIGDGTRAAGNPARPLRGAA